MFSSWIIAAQPGIRAQILHNTAISCMIYRFASVRDYACTDNGISKPILINYAENTRYAQCCIWRYRVLHCSDSARAAHHPNQYRRTSKPNDHAPPPGYLITARQGEPRPLRHYFACGHFSYLKRIPCKHGFGLKLCGLYILYITIGRRIAWRSLGGRLRGRYRKKH